MEGSRLVTFIEPLSHVVLADAWVPGVQNRRHMYLVNEQCGDTWSSLKVGIYRNGLNEDDQSASELINPSGIETLHMSLPHGFKLTIIRLYK